MRSPVLTAVAVVVKTAVVIIPRVLLEDQPILNLSKEHRLFMNHGIYRRTNLRKGLFLITIVIFCEAKS